MNNNEIHEDGLFDAPLLKGVGAVLALLIAALLLVLYLAEHP